MCDGVAGVRQAMVQPVWSCKLSYDAKNKTLYLYSYTGTRQNTCLLYTLQTYYFKLLSFGFMNLVHEIWFAGVNSWWIDGTVNIIGINACSLFNDSGWLGVSIFNAWLRVSSIKSWCGQWWMEHRVSVSMRAPSEREHENTEWAWAWVHWVSVSMRTPTNFWFSLTSCIIKP